MTAREAGVGRPAADSWDWACPHVTRRLVPASWIGRTSRQVGTLSLCLAAGHLPTRDAVALRTVTTPAASAEPEGLGEQHAGRRPSTASTRPVSTCALRPAAKNCVRGIRAAPGILAGRRGWHDRREAGVTARATTTDSGRGSHFTQQVTANTAHNGQRYGPEQPLHMANNGQHGSKRPPIGPEQPPQAANSGQYGS